MSEKIKAQHLQRKAVLYIRQSSPDQVLHNQESRKLQYAMKERLEQLGWQEIVIIDDDLGYTAAGTVTRQGFDRMVSEVCLGNVGVVAARELSRFARNSREWQQLIEMCRVVDTLLLDKEMVYAPRDSNDRLLLGLKGSLNEYELDLLRARSVEARHAKARRGELVVAAPIGFLKTADQRLEKDPDRRVQEAILLVFRKFCELGSIRQALLWFLEEGLQLPVRKPAGGTVWKRPIYATLYRLLTNPVYAGAYAYGKTETVVGYVDSKSRRAHRRKHPEKWLALIPEAHEGYISWQEFQSIQQMLADNVQGWERRGAVKRGSALLAGLLRCRRCGRKLALHYTGRQHGFLRYGCTRGWLDQGEPRCISFGGVPVDEAIGREILRVIQPAAVEAAVLASRDASRRQDDVQEALRRDLEAARYEVHEHRALEAFSPQRAPEAFDLPERLRPTRPGHDLLDAALLQLAGKSAFAPPRHILRAVVGQDLLGRAESGHRRAEHFQHQRRGLAGVQAVPDNEAAVVVHERHQINPPILPLEDKRKQVGLPQLIGFGPLEVADLVRMRPAGHLLHLIAGFVQHPRHRRGTGGQGRAAYQHVADALAAPLRVGLLQHENGAFGQFRQARAGRAALGPVHQSTWPFLLEPLLPGEQRMFGDADQVGKIRSRQAAALPGVQQQQTLFRGKRLSLFRWLHQLPAPARCSADERRRR